MCLLQKKKKEFKMKKRHGQNFLPSGSYDLKKK